MNYIISGKVIKGDGYGKKLGFPTINIKTIQAITQALPVYGVYSGEVILGTKKYGAGIVIGPLNKKRLPKIEAYLIGFRGNAYGKNAVLEIHKFIRKFRKFKKEADLIKQIKKDIRECSRA